MVRLRRFSKLGPLTRTNISYPLEGDVVNDDPIIFLKKVFGETTEAWERSDGCRSGCGACCEFVILPIDRQVRRSPHLDDWEKWLNLHGIELQTSPDKCEVRIPVPCGALQADKTCGEHGTPDRPEMCKEFPMTPMQIPNAGLEERCSYTWKREETSR